MKYVITAYSNVRCTTLFHTQQLGDVNGMTPSADLSARFNSRAAANAKIEKLKVKWQGLVRWRVQFAKDVLL